MPKLVTLVSTIVIRDGKRIAPPIGKAFDYTEAEAAYIRGQTPAGLRAPINESAVAVEGDVVEKTVVQPEDGDKPAKAAKAAKPAKAAKADDDDDDEDDDI